MERRRHGSRTGQQLLGLSTADFLTVRRRAIPEKSRLGTQFVFRQGSPLNIMDLRDIAVAQASAVIVLGDNARWGSGLGLELEVGLQV